MNIMYLCINIISAKTPWSWGRMDDILLDGREIKSRRQLEQFYRNELETEKQARPGMTIDARARSKTKLDLKLVRCEKETRFEGCELKKEREK